MTPPVDSETLRQVGYTVAADITSKGLYGLMVRDRKGSKRSSSPV